MVFTPGDPNQDLIALTETELGHRIDGDAWTQFKTDIFIADSNNDRIIKRLLTDMSFSAKIGTHGNGDDQFDQPRDVASDGVYIYVTDQLNNRIVKRLASDLSYVSQTSGEGANILSSPFGIACDGSYLYICNTGANEIQKRRCDDLSFICKIGTLGAGDGEFSAPEGIATDGTYIYVADTDNDRIQKLNCSDLSFAGKFGSTGAGDDQFAGPEAVTAGYGTYIYITDTGNNRIKKHLALDLSYVSKIGSLGAGDDEFNHPDGITSDGLFLYVADNNGNDRLVKRNCSDLAYVAQVGSHGVGDDNFDIPQGATVKNYSCWFITHADGVPVKVESNGTELTEKTSLMECHIDASSWYYAPGNKRLYLHTSGSDDPGGGSYTIIAYFWERIASEVIYLDGYEYLPYLRREDLPALNYSTGGYHEGGTRQAFGTIKWINTDGYFDARLSAYIYEAKRMLIKIGRRGAAYADYLTYFVCLTGNIKWSDSDVEVDVEDLRI